VKVLHTKGAARILGNPWHPDQDGNQTIIRETLEISRRLIIQVDSMPIQAAIIIESFLTLANRLYSGQQRIMMPKIPGPENCITQMLD